MFCRCARLLPLLPPNPSLFSAAQIAKCYKLYRGLGGLTEVDFDSVLASLRAGGSAAVIDLGHVASTRYTYVLRPQLHGLITPDFSCRTEFEVDSGGDWLGERPAAIEWLTAEVEASGQVTLRWSFRTPYGKTAPNDFGIYYGGDPDITPGSPDATEDYTSDGRYTKALSLTGGDTYYFGVTARTSGGVESHLSEVIGPFVADSAAPDAPDMYTETLW